MAPTYTFKVAAFNVNGSGPPSAPGGTTTIGAPGIPTAVTAAPGNGQAVVKWTAPASNGLAITGYTVTPLVGGVAQAPRVFNSAATTETVTGLTNGTTFTFKVAARTIFTSGLASKASVPIVVGRARRADRGDGDRRRRPGDGALDGAGHEQRRRHHRLRRDAVHRWRRRSRRGRSSRPPRPRRSPASRTEPPSCSALPRRTAAGQD